MCGLPWWKTLEGKGSACNAGDLGLVPGLGRSPEEQPTPLFLPGELHGQRSLVGYSSWGRKESDKTDEPSKRGAKAVRTEMLAAYPETCNCVVIST